MTNSVVLVVIAFLCLVASPTTTLGKYLINFQRLRDLYDTSTKSTTFKTNWPRVDKWPSPSDISRNQMFFSNNNLKFNYEDFKVWKCTYSNGSTPAVSISYPTPVSTPSTPSPSLSIPSTPSPSPPKTSLPPPTPKTSPPPPTPKVSQPPPTPNPFLLPPTPKPSPVPSTPSLPPPMSPTPSNPPPEHHYYENPWEHIERCMVNMRHATMCRMQMEASFYTGMFRVCKECCDFIVNMKNECEDVVWGFFTDPFFVPLVRNTCHVIY